MKNILYSILACALFTNSLLAQSRAPTSIEISIFTFEYAEGYQTVLLNTKKDTYDELRLSSANILGPFKVLLSEERELGLYRRDQTEDGETIYPSIARVKIPADIREPLLVLVPTPGEQAYASLVIDRSLGDFPKGTFKLINFSNKDIRALIGKTRVFAASKKVTPFNPFSNEEDLLDVHFQYKTEESWKTFGRTRWVNEESGRTLLCAFYDEDRNRMQIRGIPLRR